MNKQAGQPLHPDFCGLQPQDGKVYVGVVTRVPRFWVLRCFICFCVLAAGGAAKIKPCSSLTKVVHGEVMCGNFSAYTGGRYPNILSQLMRQGIPASSTPRVRQLVRVPKSASSSASVIARRLGGCMPRGPCCNSPGELPGGNISCAQR